MPRSASRRASGRRDGFRSASSGSRAWTIVRTRGNPGASATVLAEMQIFVTGATGYIGFAVAAALRRAGHRVRGLARSEAKARRLTQHEIDPVIGDLADPNTYLEVASDCAALVHTAFDYAAGGVAKDKSVIDTLLEAGRRAEHGEAAVGGGGWSQSRTDGSHR